MQKRERKGEKNNRRINEKKAKEVKNYVQALGELKCAFLLPLETFENVAHVVYD